MTETGGELLPLAVLGRQFGLSRATLRRWISAGWRGVKLEASWLPSGPRASVAAVQRFLAEVERIKRGGDVRPRLHKPSRASLDAEAWLRAAGW